MARTAMAGKAISSRVTTERRILSMKFIFNMNIRKRLTAVILAVIMIASSVQAPGGISYAAELTDSSIERGNQTVDEKESAVSEGEERQEDSAATVEEKTQTEESSITARDNEAESDVTEEAAENITEPAETAETEPVETEPATTEVVTEEATVEDAAEAASDGEAKPDPYNYENFDQTYTALDGATLRSKADGKPKVLIFYNNASNSQNTIKSISDHISDFSGADIYAIDCGGDTKERVSAFQMLYGCDKILFAYDETKENHINKMSEYTQKVGIPEDTEVPAPIICYIDVNDKFQLMTKGESSADDVLDNLEEYCKYAFKITYELDGGTNDSANPNSYTTKTDTIVLSGASKNGCTFDGWYKDAAFTQKVEKIEKGSKGDITLYAKWNINKYNKNNFVQNYKTVDGKTIYARADKKPKVLIFYLNDSDSCKDTIKNISEHIDRFSSADVYAIECSMATKDAVSAFQKEYGCSQIQFAYDTTEDANRNKMSKYTEAIGIEGGTDVPAPVICYIDAKNQFQLLTQGESSADDVLSNLEQYCDYAFKITYELDGGTNDSSNPNSYRFNTDTIILKNAVKEGCTFQGWYKDAAFTQNVTEIAKGSTGDITLYAKWRVNEYNLANPEQTYTALDETKLSSKADKKPKVLIFYINDSFNDYCKKTIRSIRDNIKDLSGADIYAIECGKGSKDNVSAFQKEYGCSNILFSYDTAGDINEAGMKAYELAATGKNKETHTYPYICYIDANNRFQMMTEGESSAKDILSNLKEYCGYVIPQNVYNITYELDGGTNNSGNPGIYTSGTAVALQEPVKEGYAFAGWYKDAKYSEKVTEIAKESTGDITLYAKWRVAQYNLDNFDQTYTATDGTKLSSKADGKPKVLVFYIDNSGYPRCKNTLKSISDNIDYFSGADLYAIECNKDSAGNVSNFKNDYGCEKIPFAYDTTGKVNKPSMQAYEMAATGKNVTTYTYPLICYIDKNNRFQLMTTGESSADDIMTNLQEYCSYVYQEETYQITYELNGGTNDSSNPGTYTSRTETITLKDAVKEGYKFAGWYKDAAFKEKVTEISKGSTGNITLYAKWIVKAYDLENLDQTYTAIDGTKLSSKADKKPKVLIFYFNNTVNSRNTIKSISNRIGEFYGVDIYAIECDKGTKDSVSNFQKQYGCDMISFAYDEEGNTNHPGMSAYAAAIGIPEGTTVTLPIICYIDANNKFQMLTQDESSADDVLNNLRDYCGFVSEEGVSHVTVLGGPFVYNAKTQRPKVEVTRVESGKTITLKEGTDYKLSYKNNKNAGTAKVIVTGIGQYTDSIEEPFIIEPAPLVIRAVDTVLLIDDKIPTEYEYEIDGLWGSDELTKAPILTCDIVDTKQAGEYAVIPSGADAGSNYTITYENGMLIVVEEYVFLQVIFDTQGHGKAPAAYRSVRVGDTIERPVEPRAEGYRFAGWYQDPECMKEWDFESDIVETDITLYAKWFSISSDGSFALQDIPDQCYTGKAIKPAVSVYDGDTLLKVGKDYQLKYYNNISVNADDVKKTGNGQGENFNAALPYVEIIGKGNYKDTVKVNFNILRIYLGDGGTKPAEGVVLNANDHLTKSGRPLKPSVSIKAGKKTLKKGTDFILSAFMYDTNGELTIELDRAEIPANAVGEFVVVAQGIGNYEGSIQKTIYVADSSHLMKNAKITVGKKVQTRKWTGKPVRIPSTTKEGNENAFIVQMEGKKKPITLKEGTHYRVIPWEGSAGKAELIIEGIYPYVGRQTIPFTVKGWTFSSATVQITGITDKPYTGKAHTQNKDAVVIYKGVSQPMVYGVDYTISYSKNINKGTATMTFIGNPKEGYTGNVKKTFKINARNIADTNEVIRDPSMGSIKVRYEKSGAKPVDEIILTSKEGVRLRYGKDYTLKYKDNKVVTKSATVTVTGKGNYVGTFDVPFEIVQADLSEDQIVVLPAAVPYKDNKPGDFVYKPAVKIKDGKASLSAGKDYNIEYLKNTQADYENYLTKLLAGSATQEDMPRVRITPIPNANYGLRSDLEAIEVELQIYQTKFDKKKLSVQIEEAVYTGGQATPQVTVFYDREVLEEDVHYMLSYGANEKAGKNKGSVTITGLAPDFGGSVTVKFDIISKDLKY